LRIAWRPTPDVNYFWTSSKAPVTTQCESKRNLKRGKN
jgi:hypothetical protein